MLVSCSTCNIFTVTEFDFCGSTTVGIGRRFALTEAVCFLSRLLLNWRIEPILRSGETSEQWRQRVLVAKVKMTLGLGDVPVRLVPRT